MFLLGLWPVVLLAQAPAPTLPRHHSLSLEAQSVANGGEASAKDSTKAQNGPITTTNGGRWKDRRSISATSTRINNRTNLRVDIRNLGATPDGAAAGMVFRRRSRGQHGPQSWGRRISFSTRARRM